MLTYKYAHVLTCCLYPNIGHILRYHRNKWCIKAHAKGEGENFAYYVEPSDCYVMSN